MPETEADEHSASNFQTQAGISSLKWNVNNVEQAVFWQAITDEAGFCAGGETLIGAFGRDAGFISVCPGERGRMQAMTPCERAMRMEREFLSEYAMLSENTKGRQHPYTKCEVRTEFVRDRDRIIHCKSFRRLKHKTQVFLSPAGDHYRTRLTHTLEVSQIARTIARGLRLNEDLSEAIALGHDLGHTPFGHIGEWTLNELVPDGFEHHRQSLRVVELLENDGQGLNLTFEVRDGIVNHTSSGTPKTLEGVVVQYADRIAYINHDIDDALRAQVLLESDLPGECVRVLGASHGQRINTMVLDLINFSMDKPELSMSPCVAEQFHHLRDFMFERVYLNPYAKREDEKARHVVRELYQHYLKHLEELPQEFLKHLDADGPERVAADHIACMTDRYAVSDYKRLFVPKDWV